MEEVLAPGKLKLLINYVSPSVHSCIRKCTSYSDAIKVLEAVFVKPPNEIFVKHKLTSRKQQPSETIYQHLQ